MDSPLLSSPLYLEAHVKIGPLMMWKTGFSCYEIADYLQVILHEFPSPS